MSAEAAAAALGDSGSGVRRGRPAGGQGPRQAGSAGDPGGKKTMVGKASDAAAADAGGAATGSWWGRRAEACRRPDQRQKSGGAGKWIIAAIVLFVLAGGGYFGFTRYMNNVAEQEARILSLLEQADWSPGVGRP